MSPGSTWGYTEVAGDEQPEVKVTSSVSTGSPKLSYRWRHWGSDMALCKGEPASHREKGSAPAGVRVCWGPELGVRPSAGTFAGLGSRPDPISFSVSDVDNSNL